MFIAELLIVIYAGESNCSGDDGGIAFEIKAVNTCWSQHRLALSHVVEPAVAAVDGCVTVDAHQAQEREAFLNDRCRR